MYKSEYDDGDEHDNIKYLFWEDWSKGFEFVGGINNYIIVNGLVFPCDFDKFVNNLPFLCTLEFVFYKLYINIMMVYN